MGRATRILVVSASAGNGHLRAGDALLAAARQQQPDWRIEHLDVLTLAPRWVRATYSGGFELLAARAPRVWGGIYRLADGPSADQARWGAVVERTLFRPFRRLLLQGGWDLCLCTHFLPAQLAAGRAGMPPFALVVTDFTLHRFWAQPRVQRYFVACNELASGIRARVTNAQVDVTGIPIDPAFARALPHAEACLSIGVNPDRPVIALVGGGLGIGVEENLDALLGIDLGAAQVVVVCGRNVGLRERLEQRRLPSNVQVIGFMNGMERIISAADLLVTKPGGLTTSEALALGTPIVLTRPLPGHEQGNACVLEQTGAARFAPTPGELKSTVSELLRERGRLLAMATAARTFGHVDAAGSILRHVKQELRAVAAA